MSANSLPTHIPSCFDILTRGYSFSEPALLGHGASKDEPDND
jgi:hypothetical protein